MSMDNPIYDPSQLTNEEICEELQRLETLCQYARQELEGGRATEAIGMLDEAVTGYTDHQANPLIVLQEAITIQDVLVENGLA